MSALQGDFSTLTLRASPSASFWQPYDVALVLTSPINADQTRLEVLSCMILPSPSAKLVPSLDSPTHLMQENEMDVNMICSEEPELTMQTLADVSQGQYEPIRRVSSSAPPKRFYRTFWRSLTLRATHQSRMMQKMQD